MQLLPFLQLIFSLSLATMRDYKMEDERFKGVVQWVKRYSVNPAYIEWLKENDPVAYQEIIKSQEAKV